MTSKRKAAADLFREQNMQQEASVEPEGPGDALGAEVQDVRSLGDSEGTPPPPQASPRRQPVAGEGLKTSEELQIEKEPIHVRETGIWPFKSIIVPPNVYVVHTRLGRQEPVTIGLGISFRYNPRTDAYLVVPAAMQTIGIVANSISREKQGINVLAYVQWQIDDFSIAYRKLDFSDSRDPLAIVNAQLREQAEAAIKDKIATMSVEEVLTDKAPIIEELTARLKAVAEGRSSGNQAAGEGLGIKIVTVQIKEAYVSSQRLWEHLQAPFRYEQEKIARISRLQAQEEIRQRELQNRKATETSEAETLVEIERIKQGTQTEALRTRLAEENTRRVEEQEATRQRIQLEEQMALFRQESEQRLKLEAARAEQEQHLAALRRAQEETLEQARLAAEASARQKTLQVEQLLQELAEETRLAESKLQADQHRLERETTLKRLEAELARLVQEQEDLLKQQKQDASLARVRQERLAQLELEEAAGQAKIELAKKEVEIARLQQKVGNLANEYNLASQLIARLPELAAHMPEVHELKVLQSGPEAGAFDMLSTFLVKMVALADSLGLPLGTPKAKPPAAAVEGEP